MLEVLGSKFGGITLLNEHIVQTQTPLLGLEETDSQGCGMPGRTVGEKGGAVKLRDCATSTRSLAGRLVVYCWKDDGFKGLGKKVILADDLRKPAC